MANDMELRESNLITMARESIIVRCAALLVSVISPWPLLHTRGRYEITRKAKAKKVSILADSNCSNCMAVLIPVCIMQGKGAAMNGDLKKKLNELIETAECEKGFECRDLKNLCKAEDYHLPNYVICLEQGTCQFKVPYASLVFCRCPIRVYILKNLHL